MKSQKFEDAFLRGQRDCKAGIPHKRGNSKAYDRGYAAQYAHEQVQSEISLRANRGQRRWD